MIPPLSPGRGDVWLVDLDPVHGREQAGIRPVVIVSDDRFNRTASHLVYGVPMTTRNRGFPGHILVTPPDGGLLRPSYILCDQLRILSHVRLYRHLGALAPPTLTAVEQWLRDFLNL